MSTLETIVKRYTNTRPAHHAIVGTAACSNKKCGEYKTKYQGISISFGPYLPVPEG